MKINFWSATVLSDVRERRWNLISIWLDCEHSFHPIPHEWLLLSLRNTKVPFKPINVVEHLTKQCAAVLYLVGERETVLFLMLLLPDRHFLMRFLEQLTFWSFYQEKSVKNIPVKKVKNLILHLNFCVDHVNSHVCFSNRDKKQLDLRVSFSIDTKMTFGEDNRTGNFCTVRLDFKSILFQLNQWKLVIIKE